jgi:predicted nucleic acid-binding protein
LKYLDTNVIVYAIENHPKYGERCRKILEDIEGEKLKSPPTDASNVALITSILSLFQ